MEIYQVMGTYRSNRFGSTFNSHVHTDSVVYADRDSAELTADLLNHLVAENDELVMELELHGDDELRKFYVDTFFA